MRLGAGTGTTTGEPRRDRRRSPTHDGPHAIAAFDPWRSSILLVAGDKRDRCNEWYEEAIPLAEHRYTAYLKSRAEEEDPR
ncbi:hypothetical protein RVR_6617 [Actinacidiphila reveromycinica]|uniref:Uncharacterized protein n=1 Tax=Actinacidiphila reveromycinica TaxID=659352 RepID=A0A7U3UT37_9ACTN|nr:hypothetical protein [Streptomyces sp. SN-593]BBA99825.1 hypothetical protein RVR_6617 [Streptomyces sp. SN-593]